MKSRLLHILPGPSATIRSTLPALTVYQPSLCLRLQKRFITANEKPLPEADKPGPGPNQEQLPHVSEEAAATDKIMGEEGPDIEQGTPVQEVRTSGWSWHMWSNSCSSTQVLKRDENSQIKPPRIIQEEIQKSSPKGSRPFSTAARNRQKGLTQSEREESLGLKQFQGVENGSLSKSQMSAAKSNPGHIFHLPTLPLPENDRLEQRYDPLILQLTNLLMRDGKKGLAQRVWLLIFPSITASYCSKALLPASDANIYHIEHGSDPPLSPYHSASQNESYLPSC